MSSFEPRRAAAGAISERERPQLTSSPGRWMPFGVMLAIVAGAIVAADSHRARGFFVWMDAHGGSDKLGHFVLLGGLALTLNYALRRLVQVGPARVHLGGLIIGALITLEEISQIWIPYRQFDLGDLAANYAGIVFADWLARRWLR